MEREQKNAVEVDRSEIKREIILLLSMLCNKVSCKIYKNKLSTKLLRPHKNCLTLLNKFLYTFFTS